MGKLLELSGNGKFVLRAVTDFSTQTHDYKANDIVLHSSDVQFSFTHKKMTSNKTQGSKNLLHYEEEYLDTVSINKLAVSTNLLELFSKEVLTSYNALTIDEVYVLDGIVYPTKDVLENEPYYLVNKANDIFTIEYDSENECFNVTGADESVEYDLCYYTLKDNYSYSMNDKGNSVPYLRLELILNGNKDKENNDIYVNIATVSLMHSLILDSFSNHLAYYNIQFKVIDADGSVFLGA